MIPESDYIGIDYSLGMANYDKETGIHYGVISQHAIMQECLMDFESIYPEMEDDSEEEFDCIEAIGFEYNRDGYKIIDCLDTDMMILESPYYTYCQFCSPCVPGAGNLETPVTNGVKTYCLGLDWYDEYSPCPYPHIWEVATGKQIR